jgi:hypothetical protein
LETVAAALPLFVKVIVCELFEPMATLGKLALAGLAESCACGCGFGDGVGLGLGFCETSAVTRPAHPLKQHALATVASNTTVAAALPSFSGSIRAKPHQYVTTSDPGAGMLRRV